MALLDGLAVYVHAIGGESVASLLADVPDGHFEAGQAVYRDYSADSLCVGFLRDDCDETSDKSAEE